MNKLKTTKLMAMMFLSGAIALTSCSKDDDNPTPTPIVEPSGPEVDVTDNISADQTWTSDHIYILKGRIAVLDGATLTIEPGTIIKGQAGTGANASALLVARGAKLMAEGTASQPIIFTAEADHIELGQIQSPNLSPEINGLWGGVLLCGKARISASETGGGDATEIQIEGIPTSDPNGLYGGNDDADNSGVMKYVSIRHGGTNIGAGNEINGLSLAGVGSSTVIENIEIIANQDDAIEFFGGAVSVTNAISWNVGDDGFDTDQSWGGTLTNFYVITPGDNALELDGAEGSMERAHNITKGTVICSSGDLELTDLANVDLNTIVNLSSIHYMDVVDGQVFNKTGTDAPEVTFSDITVEIPSGDDLANHVNVPTGEMIPTGITAGGSPQADKSPFTGGWSWAEAAGVLK